MGPREGLAAKLAGVVEDGSAAGLLRFTPDVPPDGQYHRLEVKLLVPRDVTLRFRAGYSYDRAPDSLRDRFRAAVWDAVDASGIALSANPARDAKGASLKLKIDAADLGIGSTDAGSAPAPDRVDVFLVERDDERQQAQITGQSLTLRLKPATYDKLMRDGIPLDQPVALKPGTTSVRVIVVDENSGRLGSVTIPAAAFPAVKAP
jgi:hypothetical protein